MNKNSEHTVPILPMMVSLVIGSVLALLSAATMLLLASFAISKCLLPESVGAQIVTFASMMGAFIGGMFAKRGWDRRKLIAGILTGIVFFLLQAVIGLLVYSNMEIASNGIGNMIGCICGGAAAGLISPRKGKRIRRKK